MKKVYERKNFIILEEHNQFIIINKKKGFKTGHTHIGDYNTSRWLIKMSEGHVTPKRLSPYLVDSLIRLNTDPTYLKKLNELKLKDETCDKL